MTGPKTGFDAIGATARWTAAARAREREQPDPLVDDPWAARLAGEEGMAWLARQQPGATLPMVLRARFFDDWLLSALDGAGPHQVVLLGVGLETRAWRLAWPAGTTVLEVDRAAVLDEKASVLAHAGAVPACRRLPVAADLVDDWAGAVVVAGLDPAVPTAWLAEGLLFYLPDTTLRDVLATVTRLSAPGSRLGFDIPSRAVLASPWTKPWLDMQAAEGAPWLGTMDDPTTELAALGWTATVTQPGEGATGHGRWTLPVPPAAVRELPHSWYVTAERHRQG
jgi:methyltransferase (TIGR00027 family)